jgi:hypothetical protein
VLCSKKKKQKKKHKPQQPKKRVIKQTDYAFQQKQGRHWDQDLDPLGHMGPFSPFQAAQAMGGGLPKQIVQKLASMFDGRIPPFHDEFGKAAQKPGFG